MLSRRNELNEVESLVEKATAPGLEPSRRVFFAAAAGRELDNIHARSIVFDFICIVYTSAGILIGFCPAAKTAVWALSKISPPSDTEICRKTFFQRASTR